MTFVIADDAAFFLKEISVKLLYPPIVWVATITAMLVAHATFPVAHSEPNAWRTVVGLICFVSGIAISSWHKRLFRRMGTNIDTFGEPDRLVESGLFRRTRNPMYLSFIVALGGLALILGSASPWPFVLGFFALAHTWYIRVEEREMEKKFGAAFRDYCLRTPRWL